MKDTQQPLEGFENHTLPFRYGKATQEIIDKQKARYGEKSTNKTLLRMVQSFEDMRIERDKQRETIHKLQTELNTERARMGSLAGAFKTFFAVINEY